MSPEAFDEVNLEAFDKAWDGVVFFPTYSAPTPLSSAFSKAYEAYFKAVKNFVDLTTRWNCRPLGLVVATQLLEFPSTVRTVARMVAYRKDPVEYGFNTIKAEHHGKNPVLLLPGRFSSWQALGDLASSLKEAGVPVFVMNLSDNAGLPTERDRLDILDKIDTIRAQYLNMFHEEAPVTHLVGHSRGGEMAFDAAFTVDCSFIDDKTGDLQFYDDKMPECNPLIGRVVTLGMPTNDKELMWAEQAQKAHDLFNIVAKYDAIVTGSSALADSHLLQVFVVDKGHLGIIDSDTYTLVKHILA